ncbi:hypothetical protein ASPSYDRAFT_96132 [Aspergillus sydowii CBS 593.65]|uniref:Uncharacterized protein n=1 Tax=Aspergillus sydowii CBS 593.65 TaxID=1036612 RepID=A0A1L9SXD7_9EURO|nr:uncharacterized protein ASPSYDRAFT_96132 [Aspergillus sydowii CBS 593.65]OJJ51840.1 hypothetical protein ASPSYDRAFT_96132 [Aspergillus sydowii CBS 593.65]
MPATSNPIIVCAENIAIYSLLRSTPTPPSRNCTDLLPVNDELGQKLYSSLPGAQSQRVQAVDIGVILCRWCKEFIHYVVKHRPELHQVLRQLFLKVFQQFGEWKSQREAIRQELRGAATVVCGSILVLVRQMRLCQQMCRRAAGSGIAGPVEVEIVEELLLHLDGWEPHFSTSTSPLQNGLGWPSEPPAFWIDIIRRGHTQAVMRGGSGTQQATV